MGDEIALKVIAQKERIALLEGLLGEAVKIVGMIEADEDTGQFVLSEFLVTADAVLAPIPGVEESPE